MSLPDGLPSPQRSWAYLSIVITMGLAIMDGTAANVALPVIAAQFDASASDSIWIVNAYQLAVVVSLLPLGSIGEIHGYKRVYMMGIALFTVASLACAISESLLVLTLSRIAQGFGAAGIMSVNAALVRYIFPQDRFGRAIGINAMVAAVASTIGPTFASAVLQFGSWHWLFAVNVPVGLVAIATAARYLPDSHRTHRRFDILSAILTAAAIGLFVTSISSFGHRLSWPLIVVQFGLSLAATLWVIRRQSEVASPMPPLDLLRIPLFALSIGTAVCSFAAQMLAYVGLPFYLHNHLGFPIAAVGLLIGPWPLAIMVAAPIAGLLSERYSAGVLGTFGLLVLTVGLLLVALLPPEPGVGSIAWRIALCGVGFGFFQAPNSKTIISTAPIVRSGAASGMLGTARLFGQATGTALVALLLAQFPQSGPVLALFTAAGFAAFGAVVSMLRVSVPSGPARR